MTSPTDPASEQTPSSEPSNDVARAGLRAGVSRLTAALGGVGIGGAATYFRLVDSPVNGVAAIIGKCATWLLLALVIMMAIAMVLQPSVPVVRKYWSLATVCWIGMDVVGLGLFALYWKTREPVWLFWSTGGFVLNYMLYRELAEARKWDSLRHLGLAAEFVNALSESASWVAHHWPGRRTDPEPHIRWFFGRDKKPAPAVLLIAALVIVLQLIVSALPSSSETSGEVPTTTVTGSTTIPP